jgi:hypothetical protein
MLIVDHFDALMGEIKLMVKILGALDDRNEHSKKSFSQEGIQVLYQKNKKFPLWGLFYGMDYSKSLAGAFWYEV